MLVILKKEVHNLGEAGEIVKIRDGYGRNFLLPRGLAIPASESNVHVLEHQQRIADAIRRKERDGANTTAARINEIALTFRREAGEDKKLFGSVTNRDIAEALEAEGFKIDRRDIVLDEPIHTIGVFHVPVKLALGVKAEVKVYVIRA